MPLAIPAQLVKHTGDFLRDWVSAQQYPAQYLANPNLYSYAFIYGPHSRFTNFSYTLNMH